MNDLATTQTRSVRGLVGIDELVEEIKDIFIEHEFNAHWEILEAHHLVGELINKKSDKDGIGVGDLIATLAPKLGRSIRTLQYSVKFYNMFPNINSLPEGKNVNWHKIIRNHLTTPKEKEEHVHSPIQVCSTCHVKLQS